jgi:Xaa-Pro aminopeptidase
MGSDDPRIDLRRMQEAIRDEGLDGWLFCDFHHRDKLSEEILHVPEDFGNSRLWVYGVPARGAPLKITHAIEPGALDGLPGSGVTYISRADLKAALQALGNKRWGAHFSEDLTAVSYLDLGTAAIFTGAGLRLESAAALIQRFKGLLDEPAIETHEKAAAALYEVVDTAWNTVKKAYAEKKPLHEGELQDLMLGEIKKRGLETDYPPIVAAGANAGNPHYHFTGIGGLIKEGDVIQFDLWAKFPNPAAIFGDISWVGVFAPAPSPRVEKAFADLVSAREGAISFIQAELGAGRPLTGAAVDLKTREILIGLGYEAALRHRTGHGIDTECHGSGVNIDSVEFPDSRLLLEGSCFSLEPGIYFADFGLRTEIDVYIRAGKPVVSGGTHARQFKMLSC